MHLSVLTAGSSFNQPLNLVESAGSSFLWGSWLTGFVSLLSGVHDAADGPSRLFVTAGCLFPNINLPKV